MSWSPYKASVIAYVAAHPGCSKWDVASHCTHSRMRCPSKQYYIVNTALRNDWIAGEQRGRQYRLYVPTAESERKRRERRDRRRTTPEQTLAQRLASYKHGKRLDAIRQQGWQIDTIRHSRYDSHGYYDCSVRVGDVNLSFRSVPTVEEVRARLAEVETRQAAEDCRRAEEYRRATEATMPVGDGLHLIIDGEGGFRFE